MSAPVRLGVADELTAVRRAAIAVVRSHLAELGETFRHPLSDPARRVAADQLGRICERDGVRHVASALAHTTRLRQVDEVHDEIAHLLDVLEGAIDADWLAREGDLVARGRPE